MKKILSASLAFILCVTMVFTFSGCMFRNPVKKLGKLIEKVNELETRLGNLKK